MVSCPTGLPFQQPVFPCVLAYSRTAAPKKEDPPDYRQWPWRYCAFASDLGTVGYLIRQPRLGLLGWLLALPYYGYALGRQPDPNSRKKEALYQMTANGIFPFAAAKIGTMAGDLAHRKAMAFLMEKYPVSGLNRLSNPMYKLIGGLAALLVLTPWVGDPLSNWIVGQYTHYLEKDV